MIVVIAGRSDDQALAFAEAWQDRGAVLLTPGDLSREGWVVQLPDSGGTFVASGTVYPTHAINAVMVRLPAVDPEELAGVAEPDREYAASEMTAFLAYWLDALPCPVVNRPSPAFLLGPGWSTEEWLTHAAAAGVPTIALERIPSVKPGQRPPLAWATVVGDRVVGEAAGEFDATLRVLAERAGVALLAAGFVDAAGSRRLARVSLTAAVADPVVQEALTDLLVPAPVRSAP